MQSSVGLTRTLTLLGDSLRAYEPDGLVIDIISASGPISDDCLLDVWVLDQPLTNVISLLPSTMAVLVELLESPYLVQGVCVALLAVFVSSFWDDLSDEIPYGRVPLVGKSWWDISNKKAKVRFTESARALIAEGFAKVNHSPRTKSY